MARRFANALLLLSGLSAVANAYWLMGIEDFLTTERMDPVVNPGKVSGHVHSVLGGSNFRLSTNTSSLRQSDCTSIPIPQDKSNYWFPHLYFQWANGSFTSLDGGAVIYYLFSDKPGTTTAFPDDFRMLSGDPTLRTYDSTSFAQQAVTFLCLNFAGTSTKYNSLPPTSCPDGIRAQINFPSCWDGKNLDSSDHKSHVAFLSGGPDSGSCSDPKFPVTLPRIFMEVYWGSNSFDSVRSKAMNTTQPFVYSYGDRTGYGYHADFINGWDKGVLQKAVDNCHCDEFGDAQCCADQGIFDLNQGKTCRNTKSIDETTTGTLPKLPGNNPIQNEGARATLLTDNVTPGLISPVFAYTGNSPTATGKVVIAPQTASPGVPASSPPAQPANPGSGGGASVPSAPAPSSSAPVHSTPVVPVGASSPVSLPTPPASGGTVKPPTGPGAGTSPPILAPVPPSNGSGSSSGSGSGSSPGNTTSKPTAVPVPVPVPAHPSTPAQPSSGNHQGDSHDHEDSCSGRRNRQKPKKTPLKSNNHHGRRTSRFHELRSRRLMYRAT